MTWSVKRIVLASAAAAGRVGTGAGHLPACSGSEYESAAASVYGPRAAAGGRFGGPGGPMGMLPMLGRPAEPDTERSATRSDDRAVAQGRMEGARRPRADGAEALNDAVTAERSTKRRSGRRAPRWPRSTPTSRSRARTPMPRWSRSDARSEDAAQVTAGRDEEADAGAAAGPPRRTSARAVGL